MDEVEVPTADTTCYSFKRNEAVGTNGLDDTIYTRFGRAPTFTIVEVDDDNIVAVKVIENPGHSAESGAGIQAVQRLVEEGVSTVIGPSPGPNAYMALQQSGIEVVNMTGVTVREALNKYLGK